ncbi:MAG TPA: ATP-binding cassette domain-containing protein, partial [Ramlibacter sp.]|nr:ATP-binding cassette domain-containing protein [Ramlibacter sp.]
MSSTNPTALLEVSGVTVRFGGITALDQVSFSVMPGTIAGLIGPNGAGKTTLFNCLSRLYTFSEGRILFEGRPLTDSAAHRIASLGIGRTFQNLALFRTMSVWQNVMLGGHCRSSSGFLSNALRMPHVRREERELAARASQVIDLLDLGASAE